MRILIISSFFPPQNSIASHRPYSWAKYWSRVGHQVTVVTTPKRHHDPLAMPMDSTGFEVVELGYGDLFDKLVARYKRHKGQAQSASNSTSVSRPGLFGRLFSALDQYRSRRGFFDMRRFPDFSHFWAGKVAKWASQHGKWDLVVSTYAPYTAHLAASRIRKGGHADFWVADYRDLWTDDHIFKGMPMVVWYENMLERNLISNADLLTTVSAPLCKKLQDRFGKTTLTIENGYEPGDLGVLPQQNAFEGLSKKIRIVYTGSIYKSTRDPSPLFEAIRRISRNASEKNILDSLEVVFVGGNIALLQEMIAEMDVEPWVRLEGFVTRSQALTMQRDADVLLFLESNVNGVDGILTGKIFEYLSSGTEVWALGVTPDSTPGQLISSSGAGSVFGSDVNAIESDLRRGLKSGSAPKNQVDSGVLIRYTREGLAMQMLKEIVTRKAQEKNLN
ncbi:MAG: hypothetical protein ACKO9S_05820 [Bacteroidota bacterium]